MSPTLYRRLAVALLVFCAAGVAPVHAQTLARGAVEGVVRDDAGAVVIEASLRLTEAGSGLVRTGTSATDGSFRFDLLPPGEYELLVEQLGFQPVRMDRIPVRPGAAVRIELALPGSEGVARSVAERSYGGAAGARRTTTFGQWMPQAGRALPLESRDLSELAKRTSVATASRSAFGLPASMLGVAVDGVQLGGRYRSSLTGDAGGASLVPLGMLSTAEMTHAAVDVEWNGAGGGFLSGYGERGGRALAVESFGTWTGSALTARSAPGADGLAFNTLQGGAVVSGPIIRDTAHFVVGVEAWRMQAPTQSEWLARGLVESVVDAARDAYGAELGEQLGTRVADRDVVTAFGRLDWQISGDHMFDVSAHLASVPTARSAGPLYGLGSGGALSGTDVTAAATLSSRLSRRWFQESRVAFVSSRRDQESGRVRAAGGDRALPNLSFVAGGLSLGDEAVIPGRFDQTSVKLQHAFYLRAGQHRWKGGLALDLDRYEHVYRYAEAGEFIFSGPAQFAQGNGYYSQIDGAALGASFSLPRFSAFLQDTWTATPGLQLLVGARLDRDGWPRDRVALNRDWFLQSGLANIDLPGSTLRLNPRLGLTWDLQDDGAWVVEAAGGRHSGYTDPHVFGELIALDGTVRQRRGFGALGGWPVLGDSAAAPIVGPALTLAARGFRAPRTTHGMVGVSRRLGGMGDVFVRGTLRDTEFLPRRSDLNLLGSSIGTDQHGRALYGRLEQHGGLVLPVNGSNRLFEDFDRVSALNADGRSRYAGVTVGFDRPAAERLRAFGSYTFSRTRDNWLGALQGADAQLVPQLTATGGGDWAEGTSDFDVPHQAVLGAELRGIGPLGLSLGGLYRFRSGQPFTPGFRAGVDLNGDGSSRNDPAFVDTSIPGTTEAIASWSCLAESAGRFAARNSCRTDAAHALDLRVGVRLFSGPRRSGEIFVDALNLVSAEPAFVDRALYLVDESGRLQSDGAGRVTVPLLINPDFGNAPVANTTGRVIRLGFQLQY
jgi:hypothetical protein